MKMGIDWIYLEDLIRTNKFKLKRDRERDGERERDHKKLGGRTSRKTVVRLKESGFDL